MSLFAKMDLSIVTNRRRIKAGAAAFGLWAWGLGYCRLEETDGLIDLDSLRLAFGEDCLVLADKLVEVGLWVSRCDGFEMLNYSKHNETKEQILTRRASDTKRQNDWRKQKMSRCDETVTNGRVTDSGSVSISVKYLTEIDVPPDREPETPHERYAKAYADGQLAAGAEAYPWPDGVAQHGALASMCAFAKGKRGAELTDWFSETSSEFRRSVDGTYNPGFMPSACVKWLSGGKPRAQRPKLVQPVAETGRSWKVGGDGKW